MTSVWLVTNGGSGEDGDEWLLNSVHATKESADLAVSTNQWHREVEEWDLDGSVLTQEEREAVEIAIEYVGSAYAVQHHAETLRKLNERLR